MDNDKKVKLICFDFDGTIANTMPVLERNAVRLFQKYHPHLSQEEAVQKYRITTGLPFLQQVKSIFPNDPNNPNMIKDFEEQKLQCIFEQELFPETKKVFKSLKEMHLLLAISSSTYKEIIDEYIRLKKLDQDVDCVLGFRPGFEKGKDHFEYLMNFFHLSSDEILFIGDSLKDMERAYNSNIKFIGRKSIMNQVFQIKNSDKYITFPSIDDLTGLFHVLEYL